MSKTNPTNTSPSTLAQSSATGRTSQNKPLEKVPAKEGQSIMKLPELLGEHNWSVWKDRMEHTLRHCGVVGYANGTIKHLSDNDQVEIWDYNDQHVILINVLDAELIYVGHCPTAHDIWQGLAAIHETIVHQTIIVII
jgi:hypothetical protein